MTDINARTPLDTDDAANKTFLGNLQGNILKGHGRNFTANIFLSFESRGDALRQTLAELTRRYVTSAYDQVAASKAFKDLGLPGKLFGNLFLTARAYKNLGFGGRLNEWFTEPVPKGARPRHSFAGGMRAAAGELGDAGDTTRIEAERLGRAYLAGTIDAMLLLGDDDEAYLLREARTAVEWIEARQATVVALEIGRALRNDDEEGIEHFGYVDGRSQPLFLQSDFTGWKAGAEAGADSREKTNDKRISRETGRIDNWNPFAPLKLVLRPDPGTAVPEAYGSYYVFRKLEQDVLHFCMAEQRLADALGLEGADRARAGAMVVGRFRDGTPLVLNETDGFIPAKANNFRYDGRDASLKPQPGASADEFALKCPFQAHIRRLNPRQIVDEAAIPDLDRDEKQREHRIVRRGITYGERKRNPGALPALDDLPTGGVGLLFACFQSSILNQFSFLQNAWASSVRFPLPGGETLPGEDPLLRPKSDGFDQRWRAEYGGKMANPPTRVFDMEMGDSHPTRFDFGGFVRFLGGEFFFAPSLPFLRNDPPPQT